MVGFGVGSVFVLFLFFGFVVVVVQPLQDKVGYAIVLFSCLADASPGHVSSFLSSSAVLRSGYLSRRYKSCVFRRLGPETRPLLR